MKTIYLVPSLLLLFFVALSCENKDTKPMQSEADVLSSEISKKLASGISAKEYEKFVRGKLKSSRTLQYTEYGPFTTPPSNNYEVPGSGRLKVWSILFFNIPGFAGANYYCKYFIHSSDITLPANSHLLSVTASNVGYKTGPLPPNPLTSSTPIDINLNRAIMGTTANFSTCTIIPKYSITGADINPSNTRIPANFTSTTYTYKYFTLFSMCGLN